jgi:hypothetical protein
MVITITMYPPKQAMTFSICEMWETEKENLEYIKVIFQTV